MPTMLACCQGARNEDSQHGKVTAVGDALYREDLGAAGLLGRRLEPRIFPAKVSLNKQEGVLPGLERVDDNQGKTTPPPG